MICGIKGTIALSANPGEKMLTNLASSELLSFLGVIPHVEFKSELVKLNTALISEVVENHEDVRVRLHSTEFYLYIS